MLKSVAAEMAVRSSGCVHDHVGPILHSILLTMARRYISKMSTFLLILNNLSING